MQELLRLISTSAHPGDPEALAESLCEDDVGYKELIRVLVRELRVRAGCCAHFCWGRESSRLKAVPVACYSCGRGLFDSLVISPCWADDIKCQSALLSLLPHACSGKGCPLASCRRSRPAPRGNQWQTGAGRGSSCRR